MCSITHYRDPSRLLITMNRDESRDRVAESPARLQQAPDGRQWLAPCDGSAPNTWIAVSENGFGGCILNRYQDRKAPVGRESRGALLPAILRESSFDTISTWFAANLSRGRFSPFTLLAFSPRHSIRYDWNGWELLPAVDSLDWECRSESGRGSWTLQSSSSWRSRSVTLWRCREFQGWLKAEAPFRGWLPLFNLMQPPGLEAWAPLMSRRSSSTRSLTQVEIDVERSRVEMRYWAWPDSLCKEPGSRVSLPLSAPDPAHV